MKVVAIIPAYNEQETIAEVIEKTRYFVDEIIVVNDGSSDRTGEIALSHGVTVVSHVINRGLGAAIGTGFAAAQKRGADIAITLDADGQHDAKEIPTFVEAIENGADAVIGSRMLNRAKMPWHRQAANLIGNFVTFFLFGAWVTDSQSGFRAFTKHAIKQIKIKTNRMEVSSELIAEIRRNDFVYKEVPIKAIYTDYSLSKGQGFFVGIKTLIKLIVRRMAG
jgi:UDP-N-acetylglucosamine---dolichyl-phosphate N-acetylglucosaminyltransferase